MNETVVLISTCLAAFLGVMAIVWMCADWLLRDERQIQQRLSHEFQLQEKQQYQKSPLFRDLKMLQSKTAGGRGVREWWNQFVLQVEQSGLPWSAPQIIGTSGILCVLSAVPVYLLTRGAITSVAAGAAGFAIPLMVVEACRQRRRKLLCEQLPDAFDQMKRAMRSGQPLSTAMQQIAIDCPAPLGDEFAMCCQQQELGLSQETALQDLARRINIMELRMFVVAVLVQRDIGGNAAEILGNLSNVVRQRFRLASKVKALTAEGRMQAMVLSALPLLAGALMIYLNAEYAQVLIDRPRLLGALAISEVVGVIWIRRIVNFDF